MISTKRFLATKGAQKFPESIKKHRFFAENKKLNKIFTQIGLPNDKIKNAYTDPEYGKLDLIFSSSGTQCHYDLATMSMRGAMSCMHWENRHSSHLIGSIVDPFCAMIYLTDRKKTEFGRSMIKRSVVRLLAKSKDHSPYLYIERIYTKSTNTDPQVYNNRCLPVQERELLRVFANYLKSKTDIEVSWAGGAYIAGYIPKFRPLESALAGGEYSMSDSGYAYHNIPVATDFMRNLQAKPPVLAP